MNMGPLRICVESRFTLIYCCLLSVKMRVNEDGVDTKGVGYNNVVIFHAFLGIFFHSGVN